MLKYSRPSRERENKVYLQAVQTWRAIRWFFSSPYTLPEVLDVASGLLPGQQKVFKMEKRPSDQEIARIVASLDRKGVGRFNIYRDGRNIRISCMKCFV